MRDNVADAVSSFAKTMGLENIKFPESGVMQFSFDNAGIFFIEDKEEGAAFYLLRELHEYNLNDTMHKALLLCHYKQNHTFDVQSALSESSKLIFLIWRKEVT